jgi:hypothetical protein
MPFFLVIYSHLVYPRLVISVSLVVSCLSQVNLEYL